MHYTPIAIISATAAVEEITNTFFLPNYPPFCQNHHQSPFQHHLKDTEKISTQKLLPCPHIVIHKTLLHILSTDDAHQPSLHILKKKNLQVVNNHPCQRRSFFFSAGHVSGLFEHLTYPQGHAVMPLVIMG